MDVLEHRKSKITGAIMANGLADRFKRGDESVMDMMKRIKEEITTDATADQWENKLEEFGVVFSHDEIPEGRTLPLSPMGAFCSAKIVCHASITWNFFCSPFVVIVVQSVTTEVVTLRDNSNDYFATHSGWLGYSKKIKRELCNQGGKF